VPTGSSAAVVAIGALAVGLSVLLTRWRAIRQTTLTGAWWWTLAAIVAWSCVELWVSLLPGITAGQSPLLLAATTLSFCPIVALLGAKRPQHAAWNLVVLSLWAIVALPAAESILLRPGQPPEMGDARGWFVWVLIGIGPINFVPTRYWLASLLVAAGQIAGLSPHLAMIGWTEISHAGSAGLVLCILGVAAAEIARRRPNGVANSLDRIWLDFRDTFGLLWGLRVQERVNAAAAQFGWGIELMWRGFRKEDSGAALPATEASVEPELQSTLKGLLRRFVSDRWIAERTVKSLD
jgi:hypothetical protein